MRVAKNLTQLIFGMLFLIGSTSLLASASKIKTIILEEKNTIAIKLPIGSDLVDRVKKELMIRSYSLPKNSTIYLFMDTPGGSLIDGLEVVQAAQAIPQNVVTITQFSASMGFIITQYLGTRYILPHGVMMSHRAYGGIRGSMPEEIENKLLFWKKFLLHIDEEISKRVDMKVKEYQDLTRNEYWVSGEDAVKDKMADEVVRVRCGKSMYGKYVQIVGTKFGDVLVVWSKCPLFSVPLTVDFSGLQLQKGSVNYNIVKNIINTLIYDKMNSTEYLIKNKKFKEILR